MRIKAVVTLAYASEGGRASPTMSGYRPPVWFGQADKTGMDLLWDFEFRFPELGDETPVPAGERTIAQMRSSMVEPEGLEVQPGQAFEAREGRRVTIRGHVLEVSSG